MHNLFDKTAESIKKIKKIQDLIGQGLGKPEEKEEAYRIAKETAGLFTDDILKRKVEKQNRVTVWTHQSKTGFCDPKEAEDLNVWLELLDEFMDARKIKAEISSEKMHIKSVVDGEDQHIFITEKGSGEHTHLILDGGTGEIRIDPKDISPHELIKSVTASLELKSGEIVKVTKSALTFGVPESSRPDVRAYTSDKDNYFVLEVYNSGDEDLENFKVVGEWVQPEGQQKRVFDRFNEENEYLVMATPKVLNMLKKGGRVYTHIPSTSVDKKLKITIFCKGMRSGLAVEKEFNLETQNDYPKQ
jgi:hypothetical protein